jgi:hypothetical protein
MIQQHTRGNAKRARTRRQLLKAECYGSRTNEQRLVLKRLSVAGFEVIGDILQPFLEEDVSLTHIARQQGLALRTVQHWVMRYRKHGLAGLCRKEHVGKGQHRLSTDLQQAIERFALQKPQLSVAAIYRKTVLLARQRGEPTPSYGTVYLLIRRLIWCTALKRKGPTPSGRRTIRNSDILVKDDRRAVSE